MKQVEQYEVRYHSDTRTMEVLRKMPNSNTTWEHYGKFKFAWASPIGMALALVVKLAVGQVRIDRNEERPDDLNYNEYRSNA